MKSLTKRYENKLRKKGLALIAGIDEVGKGSLAGPIVAACVILPHDFKVSGINDSKTLSPVQREKLFVQIVKNAVEWSIGIVEHDLIDKIGIQEANAQVFKRAIKKLKTTPDYLLIDGRNIAHHPMPHEYIIGGDGKIMSIAAASIVAKVTRDRIMDMHHKEFPQYGFNEHKGYGTVKHLSAIKTHGPSRIHRRSFSPMRPAL